METEFQKQSFIHFNCLWSGPVTSNTATETVVPDNMPDVGAVIDCGAMLYIRSKECDDGRLTITADVESMIVYQDEEMSGLFSLPLKTTVSLVASAPEIDPDCLCSVRLRVRSTDCKILNSRKVSFRAEIAGTAACYRRESFEIASGITDQSKDIEIKPAESSLCLVSDVREKTFVLSDDFSLPSGCDEAEQVLMQNVSLQVDETELAGDKLVFRGRSICFLLIRREGRLYPCSFESPFSQVIDVSGDLESAPDISLILTGAYFDPSDNGGGKIGSEIHVLAQIVCMKKYRFRYIADAYSNRLPICPIFSENRISSDRRLVIMNRTVTETPDAKREMRDILYTRAYVSSASVENNALQIALSARCIYKRGDGSFGCFSHRIQKQFELEAAEGEDISIRNILTTGANAAISGDDIELRISLVIHCVAKNDKMLKTVIAFEEEQRRADHPSVTLLHCGGEEELWTLAKEHHSSIDAILEANEGRTEGLLLIPKCR